MRDDYCVIRRFSQSRLAQGGSNRSVYHQLNCTLDGKRLLGLGPTLSQLVWVLPWGDRAWTFQEALLSQRCIYITTYRAYFECNSMQCCGSLDESRSWVHQSLRDEALLKNAPGLPTFGTGVLRSPFIPHSKVHDSRLEKHNTLLTLYKYRSLTKQSDGINAFSGILQALERSEYTEGFFWGLPIADLNRALLWDARAWYSAKPRTGWASWGGPIWPCKPQAQRQGDPAPNPRQYPVDLKMWRRRKGNVEKIFETSYHDIDSTELSKFPNDPLSKDIKLDDTIYLQNLADFPPEGKNHLLCIEGVIFNFAPDLSEPEDEDFDGDGYKYFTLYIRDVPVILHIIDSNELLSASYTGDKCMFLLLARNLQGEWVKHFLLMIKQAADREIFERCGVVELEVRRGRLKVLRELGMRRGRVVVG